MMATAYDEKPVASRLSDTERYPDLKGSLVAAGFEDPDEGLSDEERAAIVGHPLIPPFRCIECCFGAIPDHCTHMLYRIGNYYGNSISV
jgi:hypothetical protein